MARLPPEHNSNELMIWGKDYDLAYFNIANYISSYAQSNQKKGFKKVDVKIFFKEEWNENYERAWRNLSKNAVRKEILFFEDGFWHSW